MKLEISAGDAVVYLALGLCALSFILFGFEAAAKIKLQRKASKALPEKSKKGTADQAAFTTEEVGKVADAAARLAEVFNKATPGTVAIVASLLYLAIAAYVVKPAAETPKKSDINNSNIGKPVDQQNH